MTTIRSNHARRAAVWVLALMLGLTPVLALGQTRVEMPSNKYSVQQDVQLGQEAAQQVYQQMPILRDNVIDEYVESVGRRLVAAIPGEYQQPGFRYSFDVVDARDINAFALPGGPMFVNRGMIEAARTEGEMAGVMAHEISHVALRHATAQATETQKFQIGSVLGQIAGAVIGGVPGAVIGTASQIGFGAGALKYSRKYETQSDILGAQIMARAGYDPRDLANMFRTIERQGGGSGGPEWLSSHPNPGNRYERINQEATLLRVAPGSGNSRGFQQAQARLRGFPRARTMEEIARSGQRYPNQGGGSNYPNDQRNTGEYGTARGERVTYPSASYQRVNNNLFSANIPGNWQQLGGDGNTVSYAPAGAYGSQGITHGVMIGVAPSQGGNLNRSAQQYINGLLQSNNYLRQSRQFEQHSISGRRAIATTLNGRSPITGRNEQVRVVMTLLRNGDMFYMAQVVPQNEYNNYEPAFRTIWNSLQLNDR
jgi:Zn-dependent protease with chaperone function